MILIPYQYNGTSLQSTDYSSSFPRSQSNLQMTTNPSYVKRAGAVPVYSGKDFMPTVVNLEIIMQHDFMTLFESLNQLFDTKDETPHQLICTDSEDSDKQYYVYATAKQVQGGHDGTMAVVTLALDDPIWQSVTQNSQAWSITGTTSTTDATNNGNDYAYPVFEISPGGQPTTDYAYGFYVQVVPQSSYPWANRFLDITGSTDTTFDTAALVTAGKMQADGDDLRVFRDGVEVDRWLNGINTTDTHVIVTCDMPPQRLFFLKTAIGATDTVTEIEFTFYVNDFAELNDMPASGRVIICSALGATDTEEFTYSSKTAIGSYPYKLALEIEERAIRNTVASSHSVGALVYHVPYDFTIVYGNASSTARATDDTKKPIQSLTSRNWSFVYPNFFNTGARRPNVWNPYSYLFTSNSRQSQSKKYTSTDNLGDTDPATALGIGTRTYESFGTWQPDAIDIGWVGYFGDGVASITASGAQRQNTANIPAMKLIGRDWTNEAFYTVFEVSAQASTDYGTWTTWSKASTDCTIQGATIQLIFSQSGQISGSTDNYNEVEIDAITVGLTNYPNVQLRTEAGSVSLNAKITNQTTGEHFTINIPINASDTVIIDTNPDFPTVTYKGITSNGSISLSSTRAAWLALQPGSNTLTFESNLSVAFNLTITIKWNDRMNFL